MEMLSSLVSTMVVFALVGCLLIGISVPLIQRRIKPNPWYGFRVPKTLRNPDIWYAANAYMARRMIVCGVLTLLAAIGFAPFGLIPKVGLGFYVFSCAAPKRCSTPSCSSRKKSITSAAASSARST